MKKTKEPEKRLDFSKAVRGKYYARVQQGTNLMLIAPDLLDAFPNSEAVNDALRTLKTIADRSSKPPVRTRSRIPSTGKAVANK